MAVGEKIIFDINKFLMHWDKPDAIGIICYTEDELREAICYIEKLSDNKTILKQLLDFKIKASCYFEECDWVTLYAIEVEDNIRLSLDMDHQVDYKFEKSDYLFSDITFPDLPMMILYQNNLSDFLK